MELACQIELCPPYGYRMLYIFSFIVPTITRVKKLIITSQSDCDYRISIISHFCLFTYLKLVLILKKPLFYRLRQNCKITVTKYTDISNKALKTSIRDNVQVRATNSQIFSS